MSLDIQKIRDLTETNNLHTLLNSELSPESLLAAGCLASEQALSQKPFDEQLQAAGYLYCGNVIEMATGEGKTLAAVLAALLLCRLPEPEHNRDLPPDKRRVHILTFNDYLAKRDYNWMKPVYDLLNLSVAAVTTDTPGNIRKEAYKSDVVYSTAKEAGFDYLRDFLAESPENIVHSKLDTAIFDEADSILIDEARVPLVISGVVADAFDQYIDFDIDLDSKKDVFTRLRDIMGFVKLLPPDCYQVTKEKSNVYLRENGVAAVEEHFDIENLYDGDHAGLLSLINDSLKALYLLKENEDYIVNESRESREILIIDEFTGRAARGRRYPGLLQAAVEQKHGVFNRENVSSVLATIPIQFFARQYRRTSGMTGTVKPSDGEFELLYGLKMKQIPPHKACVRTDLPLELYYNKEIKMKHIVNDIITAHKKHQPVLIGVSDIAECDELLALLQRSGIENIKTLTAKNDEAEAAVIKNAGAADAVTISANMAGRGVDIVLGGERGESREVVAAAGGLYVISTSLRENPRVNRQLEGRAGRQGDPGMSKTFVSLDDEIMHKHDLKKLVPERKWPAFTEDIITEKAVLNEVLRVQRIAQGDDFDARERLLKFTTITEKHRGIIFHTREQILSGEIEPDFWESGDAELFAEVSARFGEENVRNAERKSAAAAFNAVWREYLEFSEDLRSGIHLTSVGGKSPTEEFNIECEKFFGELKQRAADVAVTYLQSLADCEHFADFKVPQPERVRTYLLEENGDELVRKPFLQSVLSDAEELDSDSGDLRTAAAENSPANNKKPGLLSKIKIFGKKND